MSQQNSNSYSYSSYSSFSSSSTGGPGGDQVSGYRSMQTSTTDGSGTTVRSAQQNLGQPVVQEERRYDPQGRELLGGFESTGGSRRIEDVTDEQRQRDREYEERIEDEYAKREGGA